MDGLISAEGSVLHTTQTLSLESAFNNVAFDKEVYAVVFIVHEIICRSLSNT